MRVYAIIATQDPWEHYKDKDHGHRPKVPEPATYGLIFVALMVILGIWMRRRK